MLFFLECRNSLNSYDYVSILLQNQSRFRVRTLSLAMLKRDELSEAVQKLRSLFWLRKTAIMDQYKDVKKIDSLLEPFLLVSFRSKLNKLKKLILSGGAYFKNVLLV